SHSVFLIGSKTIACEGDPTSIQDILLTKRLGQELDCAGFHRPDRHGYIAVAGYEDDRCLDFCLGQLALKIEPANPRQADIQDQAICTSGLLAVQEFLC